MGNVVSIREKDTKKHILTTGIMPLIATLLIYFSRDTPVAASKGLTRLPLQDFNEILDH